MVNDPKIINLKSQISNTKVLIVPLSWGLGHATRCIPLIRRYLDAGAQVAIGGTGDALRLLQHYFPHLPVYPLAPLELRYSSGNRQVFAMLRALPRLLRFARTNRRLTQQLAEQQHFDLIISDNCFGVWADCCDCVYITHQLHIMLPRPWRWLENLVSRLHARTYARYKEVWVPDYATDSDSPLGFTLSGALGHEISNHKSKIKNQRSKIINLKSQILNLKSKILNHKSKILNLQSKILNHKSKILNHKSKILNLQYIGSLSRFSLAQCPNDQINEQIVNESMVNAYDYAVIVSGLEPHRTMFENAIRDRLTASGSSFIIYSGLSDIPAEVLRSAKHIIARSGYSTIMDLHALGVLHKAELHPTPGQPEQTYLAQYIAENLEKRGDSSE